MMMMTMTERRPQNSSVDRCAIILTRCISIFTRHTFRTYKTFKCTAIPISVGSAARVCLKTRVNWTDTSARAREVCVGSILVACTIRLRRCSNVWTTRTSESPNRCGTIRTEPPLTLSVGSIRNNFLWTVTRSTGLRVTSRWASAWHPTCPDTNQCNVSSRMETPTSWWAPWWTSCNRWVTPPTKT